MCLLLWYIKGKKIFIECFYYFKSVYSVVMFLLSEMKQINGFHTQNII